MDRGIAMNILRAPHRLDARTLAGTSLIFAVAALAGLVIWCFCFGSARVAAASTSCSTAACSLPVAS